MSDFRTPLSTALPEAPADMQDGLNMGNVAPQVVLPTTPNIINYASDPQVKQRAETEVWPLIQQTRIDRREVEDNWRAIRRMTQMVHDENQKYKGRSNAYLPIHAKNIQAQATALQRGLFPSDEYIDAQIEDPGDPEAAVKAKHFMQYQFERQANIRIYMKLFGRQLLDYGFSVLKFWWRMPQSYASGRVVKNANALAEMAFAQPNNNLESDDQGLTVSARNIFNFYAYPFTAETLREAILQFEDIQMSMLELEYAAKAGKWEADQAVLDAAPTPVMLQWDNQERLAEQGIPSQENNASGTKLGDVRMVTEAYTFMVLPKSAYTQADRPDCPLPVRIIFLDNVAVSIERNASYHQSSPFLGLSLNANPGYMYGYGPGRMIAPLQYLANDFVNQSNDVCIYGLNPIIKAVPGMLVGRLRPIAPGVTWYMNDLNAVDMIHPPVEQLQWGVQMGQQMVSMAQDFGGAPPAMQGTGARGSAKTATGAQILQKNSMEPLQDMVEDIENEVFVPLASRTWKLAQQYAPQELMTTVFGQTRKITRSDLLRNAEWRWLASSQSANAQTRAMQTIQFLQVLLPYQQVLQQQGVQLNVIPVLKNLYTQALGFRGWDELMKPAVPNMPPPPGMPGMGGPPGMPPGMGGGMPPGGPGGMPPGIPPDQQPRSTTEQAQGGGLPIQPGEGDEHMAMRSNADMLSAIQGALQGGGEE